MPSSPAKRPKGRRQHYKPHKPPISFTRSLPNQLARRPTSIPRLLLGGGPLRGPHVIVGSTPPQPHGINVSRSPTGRGHQFRKPQVDGAGSGSGCPRPRLVNSPRPTRPNSGHERSSRGRAAVRATAPLSLLARRRLAAATVRRGCQDASQAANTRLFRACPSLVARTPSCRNRLASARRRSLPTRRYRPWPAPRASYCRR